MTLFEKTQDGRYIGVSVIEVSSIPDVHNFEWEEKEILFQNAKAFEQMIRGLYGICTNHQAVMEILWISEPVMGQIFCSAVRIYVVIRSMGTGYEDVNLRLGAIQSSVVTTLRMGKYVHRIIEDEKELRGILLPVDCECVYALKKNCRQVVSASVQGALSYCEIIPEDSEDNFEAMISAMSQLYNCAVSFQLIPTTMPHEELYVLGNMVNAYNSVYSGMAGYNTVMQGNDIAAYEPMVVSNYYYGKCRNEIFNYNLMVVGNREACTILANKLQSIIAAGNKKISEFSMNVIEVGGLNIQLYRDFVVYPWNLCNFLNVVTMPAGNYDNAFLLASKLTGIVTTEEALSFFRLPIHNDNIAAVNSEYVFVCKEQLQDSVVAEDNIQFGQVKDINGKTMRLGCLPQKFTQHALVVGAPGNGKTTFALGLLLQLYKKGVPFLAIEPTKNEYRALIDNIPDLQIFTPGKNEVSPFIINPFLPPPGVTIEQHKSALKVAFEAAFSMPNPLDVLFSNALSKCYKMYGWRDYSKLGDRGVVKFGLYEFILVFKQLIAEGNYKGEQKANIESGGVYRLGDLIEKNANIFDTVNTIPIEDIISKPTVIEMNAIGSDEEKSLILALLLKLIDLYIKLVRKSDNEIQNVILIDEAHVFLQSDEGAKSEAKSNPKGKALALVQRMLAEVRGCNTGLIIADQSPDAVSLNVVRNTNIKIVFRLMEQRDKDIISNSINVSAPMRHALGNLAKGEAMVFWDDLKSPQVIHTPDWHKIENIRLSVEDAEIISKSQYWRGKEKYLLPYNECLRCKACNMQCDARVRADAAYYASVLYDLFKKKLVDETACLRYMASIGEIIDGDLEGQDEKYKKRLIQCCIIAIRRKIQLESNVKISQKKMDMILEKEN